MKGLQRGPKRLQPAQHPVAYPVSVLSPSSGVPLTRPASFRLAETQAPEEADQFIRGKLQSTVVELSAPVYCVANGQTHSGHATLSQYLGLAGPATKVPEHCRAVCAAAAPG